MNRINRQLEIVLDNICHHGCKYVRECIIKIKTDEVFIEIKSITIDEQQIILQELVSIMDVYDMQK